MVHITRAWENHEKNQSEVEKIMNSMKQTIFLEQPFN
jgi:hypothetical protein